MAKRRVSPQTRVKLSQAAKKRRRGLKGTSNAGHFLEGLHFSGASRLAASGESGERGRQRDAAGRGSARKSGGYKGTPGGPEGMKGQKGDTVPPGSFPNARGRTPRETYSTAEEKYKRMDPERAATEAAMWELRAKHPGVDIGPDIVPQRGAPSSVDVEMAQKYHKDQELERNWRDATTFKTNEPVSPARFIAGLPPSAKAWLDQELNDPRSAFNEGTDMAGGRSRTKGVSSHAARRRRDTYLNLRQRGYSHSEAEKYVRTRRPGRKPGDTRTRRDPGRRSPTRDAIGGVSREEIDKIATRRRSPQGSRDKYKTAPTSARDTLIGVRAPAVPKKGFLGREFPDVNDQDLIRIQQASRETIGEQLQRNQYWTHETKRANIQGKSRDPRGPDRVTFFTTTLGDPGVSVPTDSLVGQYIIKRRKRIATDEKLASRQQLKGRFPQAVRDMHIIEFGTGLSLGAEGVGGVYQKTGWRSGTKKSKNYGKPVPVGSTILRSASGQPIYDAEGNIRYTEGGARHFRVESPEELGLRIFIG